MARRRLRTNGECTRCYICSSSASPTAVIDFRASEGPPVPMATWKEFFKEKLPWKPGSKSICKSCIQKLKKFHQMKQDLLEMQQEMLAQVETGNESESGDEIEFNVTPEATYSRKDQVDQVVEEHCSEEQQRSRIEIASKGSNAVPQQKLETPVLSPSREVRKNAEKAIGHPNSLKNQQLLPVQYGRTRRRTEIRNSVVVPSSAASEDTSTGVMSHCRISKYRGVSRFMCRSCYEYFDSQEDFVHHFNEEHNRGIPSAEMMSESIEGNDPLHQSDTIDQEDLDATDCITGIISSEGSDSQEVIVAEDIGPGQGKESSMDDHVLGMAVDEGEEEVAYYEEVKVGGEVKLACRLCSAEYSTKEDFDEHLTSGHAVSTTFSDKINDATASTSGSLRKAGRFHCSEEDCTDVFSSLVKLRHHINNVHVQATYQCPVCQEVVAQLKEFRKHLTSHEAKGEAAFKCDICQNVFPTYKALSDHRPTHVVGFPCKYCKKLFPSRRTRRDHYQTHTVERPYECGECAERFEDRTTLAHHMKVHTKTPTTIFKCLLCSEQFTCRNSRRLHEQNDHVGCPSCDMKDFENFNALVSHVRHIHGLGVGAPSKWNCLMCDAVFRSQGALHYHMARKHDVKEVARPLHHCPDCGQTFTYKSNMDNHYSQFHAEVARFQCRLCPKRLGSKSALKRHVERSHQKLTKYACTECSKTFTYPSMLQKHRRIHSGERKYDCPICARSFATWDNRHVHMFAHTKKRLYECKHCGEGFMRKAQARLHVDHMHREYALEPLADSIRKNKPFKYLGDGRIVENYDTGDEGRVLEPGMKTTTYPKADPNEVITHVVGVAEEMQEFSLTDVTGSNDVKVLNEAGEEMFVVVAGEGDFLTEELTGGEFLLVEG